MKTNLKNDVELKFNSEIKYVLGFTLKNYPAGTLLCEKPTTIADIYEFLVKHMCADGSIVNGRRESFLYSFSLAVPPILKINKEILLILFKKAKKRLLVKRQFLKKDDVNVVYLNSETLTFTVTLLKV